MSNPIKKYNAIWPLPGGVENYFNALQEILSYVDENNPILDQLVQAMKDLFPSMSGDHVIKTQLLIHQHMGLMQIVKGKYETTDEGKGLLDNPDPEKAYACLSQSHIGFNKLLLKLSEGPLTTKEIHAYLKRYVNENWTHQSQPNYRIHWLRSLGLAEKDGAKIHKPRRLL